MIKSFVSGLLVATALLSAGTAVAQTAAAPASVQISRADLFGNPVRAAPSLSPDGKWMSFIAPHNGVLNVWVAPLGQLDKARVITNDTKRGIRQHFWAEDGKTVLYIQDEGGDENFRLYGVDVASAKVTDLTPLKGVQAQVWAMSERRPNEVIVGLNNRDARYHDAWRIDLRTGKRTLVYQNTRGFGDFDFDADNRLRLARESKEDGSFVTYSRVGKEWQPLFTTPPADSLTTSTIGFDGTGTKLLMLDSIGRDRAALVELDMKTNTRRVIATHDRADIGGVWRHPTTRALQAYAVNYLKAEAIPLTDEAKRDVERIRAQLKGQVSVTSRTNDDRLWVVAEDRSDSPMTMHLYDRSAGTITKLFTTRPALEGKPLARMLGVEIKSRDGLTLPSYLTLPTGSDPDGDGVPNRPVPLVLNVHGGPWARDTYGFDSEAQWMANRGYAVLQVNFRGSTGFGKAFVNAGDREWAKAMHNDLLDAVDWAVKRGVTTPDRVAIYGGSYGGYAALVGVTFTPTTFACAVDIVGPSNLQTLLASVPPYWKAFFEDLARRVGDPRTEEGRALLAERSPISRVDQIVRPLLIAQGANDPRVKQAESDQIVTAMQARNIPVTYVLYPDEGHGFARPQNRTSFYAVSEAFLSNCLGGTFQPVGSDFQGSSITVPQGAQHVPGLKDGLSTISR
jgi:dipeptidyl aminopeptidase/acylaminoacyl peptidase